MVQVGHLTQGAHMTRTDRPNKANRDRSQYPHPPSRPHGHHVELHPSAVGAGHTLRLRPFRVQSQRRRPHRSAHRMSPAEYLGDVAGLVIIVTLLFLAMSL